MLGNLPIAQLQGSNQPSNPLDRRRFVGPDSSTAFADFPGTSRGAHSSNSSRSDGRSSLDSRPLSIKTGIICQANGSCYLESGYSKVICAVYGPKPRPSSSSSSTASPLVMSLKFAPFCMPGGRLIPTATGNIETTISQSTQQALLPSLLPMSETSIVEIHITVLEWDNPLSSSLCVLASTIAMASAGIPMLGLVIPTTLALGQEEPWLDPTAHESTSASAIFDLACIPAMDTITHLSFSSTADWKSAPVELELFERCLDMCKSSAALIHDLATAALKGQVPTQQ